MKLPPDGNDNDGPNLTPVIDVVFLLLIFFLVATQYAKDEREQDVALPEVAEAQALSQTSDLIINIRADGSYVVAKQEYNEKQLASLIAEAKRNNPHQTALIRGDATSDLVYAARALSLCDQAQMQRRLAVEQQK